MKHRHRVQVGRRSVAVAALVLFVVVVVGLLMMSRIESVELGLDGMGQYLSDVCVRASNLPR